MTEQANLHTKTEQYTHKAELGLNPEGIHESLLHDMKHMTVAQYQKMLSGITDLNEKDRQANNHLPKLELFSSTGSPIPDSIRANYDGKSVEGAAQQQAAAAQEGHSLTGALDGKQPTGQGGAGEGKVSDSKGIQSSLPSATGFSEALLQKIGAPVTPANMAVLDAWTKAEGSGDANNPFDVVTRGSAAHDSGVQHFSSIEAGVDATAKLLEQGPYKDILQALHDGNNARDTAAAVARSPWGTGTGIMGLIK